MAQETKEVKKSEKKLRPPAIMRCHCVHEYQDKTYGPSLRLHNFATAKQVFRCTVCKSEKA